MSVVGYGVDASGKMNSHLRSISQPYEHQRVDEIIFARTDVASGNEHYSKSIHNNRKASMRVESRMAPRMECKS